jgi:hypothetical protein
MRTPYSTRYQVPGTWYQVPGTRYQVQTARYTPTRRTVRTLIQIIKTYTDLLRKPHRPPSTLAYTGHAHGPSHYIHPGYPVFKFFFTRDRARRLAYDCASLITAPPCMHACTQSIPTNYLQVNNGRIHNATMPPCPTPHSQPNKSSHPPSSPSSPSISSHISLHSLTLLCSSHPPLL